MLCRSIPSAPPLAGLGMGGRRAARASAGVTGGPGPGRVRTADHGNDLGAGHVERIIKTLRTVPSRWLRKKDLKKKETYPLVGWRRRRHACKRWSHESPH